MANFSSFCRHPFFLWVFAASLLAGCGGGPVNEKVTPENANKIRLEMKLAEIEAILGPGEASSPAPSAKPEDSKLTWKRWRHSSRGSEVIVGFDATNTAAVVDKKIPK